MLLWKHAESQKECLSSSELFQRFDRLTILRGKRKGFVIQIYFVPLMLNSRLLRPGAHQAHKAEEPINRLFKKLGESE